MANHIPYGYRIEHGIAVIDTEKAEQIKTLFNSYLSGLALVAAAESVGLSMYPSTVKKTLQNRHYLGDDFYPKIIDSEIFDKAAEELLNRAERLGRNRKQTIEEPLKVETAFVIKKASHKYDDPFKQAEYIYSLIESEEHNG